MVKWTCKEFNDFIDKRPNLWATIVLSTSIFFMLITVITVGISNTNDDDLTFDYIIVGGGIEGAIMAYRLSNSAHDRVLLLEAGYDAGDDDPRLNDTTPDTLNLETEYFSRYFWQYRQDKPEVVPWTTVREYTTGKVLGGESSVNNMIYTRGTDYLTSRWPDPIWDPIRTLQAFINMETYYGVGYDVNRRGNSGLFAVTEEFTSGAQNSPTTISQKFINAIQQMIMNVYPVLADYNNLDTASWWGSFYGLQLHNKPTGGRTSTANTFLNQGVRMRKNLGIRTEALVTRIIFDPRNRASGVEFYQGSRLYRASANKEIILCAGPFTPVLLQASGVGNETTLRNVGIDVVADSPGVGQNITVQLAVDVIFERNSLDTLSANPGDLFEGGAFLPNVLINDPYDDENSSPRKYMIYGTALEDDYFQVRLVDLNPHSKGIIVPASNDKFRVMTSSDHIFEGDLGQHDLDLMVLAFNQYICGIASEYIGTGNGPPVDPIYTMSTPSASICSNSLVLRQWIIDNVHVHERQRTGGAAMGSVVNTKGSVLGTSGLRVADSSIIPFGVDGTRVGPSTLIAYTLATEVLLGIHE